MTPAFGFSVGDFISAIELCTKVSKALKDTTTGASADYQHVALELQALQNALSRLASLEPTESNINHVNAIRGMALACQLPLREFLSNIRTGHKAKWAVVVAEEVKKIRALVSAKTISINLLLNLHTSEAVSRLESRGQSQHNQLLRNIEEHRLKFQGISRQVDEVKDEVVRSRQAASTEVKKLETEVQSRLEGMSEKTADLAQSMSGLRSEISSAQNSIFSLRDSTSQILGFLRKFPSDIRRLLHSIIWTNIQMYHVLLKIDGKVSASPSMLSPSSIRFEDALGVIRELPHEWFKYWEPFEGLLHAQFKDAPGENKVLQGQYHIAFAKRPGVFIDKKAWTRSIQPGSEIVMSVLMTEMRWQMSSCPRPSCSGKPYFDIDKPAIVVCPLCGLKYFPLPSTFHQIPNRLIATEDEYVSLTQAKEDFELFGDREIPTDDGVGPTGINADLFRNNLENISLDTSFENTFSQVENDTGGLVAFIGNDEMNGSSVSEDNLRGCKPEPPLLSWLERTEPPENPTVVQCHLQEKQLLEEKARLDELEDIELFRNIHVVLSQHEPDNPAPQRGLSIHGEDELELAARIYYRNIVDRYPAIPHYLARCLAEANLCRAKRLSEKRSFIVQQKDTGEAVLEINPSPNLSTPDHSYFSAGEPIIQRAFSAEQQTSTSQMESSSAASPLYECSFKPCAYKSKRESNCKKHMERAHGLIQPKANKKGAENSYWTNSPTPSRPSSCSSSMNSSLHGYDVFDPQEQNMNVPASIRGSASPPIMRPHTFPSDEQNKDVLDSARRAHCIPSFRQPLPPPPIELPSLSPFECDICGSTIKVTRKRDWKKHVLHDLQPYICTIEGCEHPGITFSKRRDLIRHELRYHKLSDSFYQCTRSQCGDKLKDPESVSRHQRITHNTPIEVMRYTLADESIVLIDDENYRPRPSLGAVYCDCDSCKDCIRHILSLSYFPRPCRRCENASLSCGIEKLQLSTNCCFDLSTLKIPNYECPFCKKLIAPGNLPRSHHLGRHMEEVSFLVVTKPYEDWLFYDNSSGDSVRSGSEHDSR